MRTDRVRKGRGVNAAEDADLHSEGDRAVAAATRCPQRACSPTRGRSPAARSAAPGRRARASAAAPREVLRRAAVAPPWPSSRPRRRPHEALWRRPPLLGAVAGRAPLLRVPAVRPCSALRGRRAVAAAGARRPRGGAAAEAGAAGIARGRLRFAMGRITINRAGKRPAPNPH